MVLIANGTFLAIQNMTWNGPVGLQSKPSSSLYVLYHGPTDRSASCHARRRRCHGATHIERGLTWAGMDLSPRLVPSYAPDVAYRRWSSC